MTLKISKPLFLEILQHLEDVENYEQDIRELNRRYKRLDLPYDFYTYANIDYIIDLLSIITNDDGGWIYWWVHDTKFGTLDCCYSYGAKDPTIRYMRTAEDLYDYLEKENQ